MTTARTTSEIRAQVEAMLLAGESPRQVARALKADGCTLFGDDGDDSDAVALPGWLADDGGLTLHDLAAEYGVSAERIRQIEAKALAKLRKHRESKKLKDYLR